MRISKESIKEFLEAVLDWSHDEFDEFEKDSEFDFEDGTIGTCDSVSTNSFRVEVNNFEVEMVDEKVLCISGMARAGYDTIGSFWDGDWDDEGGYQECASGTGNADFTFTIWPEGDELNEEVSISIV